MLIVKSKYRIARRLGAGVFDQTQTQKFALNEANRTVKKMRRTSSDYGRQLLEKQRVRFTYGLSEKQLSAYAHKAITTPAPAQALHVALEMRLDNAVYRSGLAKTRRASRQAVSHGHILVNGTRITVPSYRVKKGDVITVREGSRKSTLFSNLAEMNPEGRFIPQWVKPDLSAFSVEVVGDPQHTPLETGLDYAVVFEFYSR